MASSSLTPYKDNSNQVTFNLVTTSQNGSTYKVSGRELALPHVVEIQRKLTSNNSTGNDHVILRGARTERNATTGKLATAQVMVDISIPKDQSTLDATAQAELLSCVASLLNEASAMEATHANITALIEGRDL
jgi:hypothetical protein